MKRNKWDLLTTYVLNSKAYPETAEIIPQRLGL